jgi:VanZ family protein
VCVIGALLLVATLVPAPVRDPPRPTPLHLDKAFHFLSHAVFTAAFVATLEERRRSRLGVASAVLVSTVYGVALERLQERIPGRRYETGDVVASALGSVLGGVATHRRR